MNFPDYMDSRKEMIEAALDMLLPAAKTHPAVIHEAMRYAVFPGGKRFRAVLVAAAYETFEKHPADVMPFACAVELIHSYSLVHDDLPALDDDEFRRGKPSVHKKFGEAIAVLAGDALLTTAFSFISDQAADRFNAEQRLAVVSELAGASGTMGMIGGQVVDMERAGRFTRSDLEYIHLKKTAELIKSSVRIGAMLGGADAPQLEKISSYGTSLGLSFQMLDDIKDSGESGVEPNFARSLGRTSAGGKADEYADEALKSLSTIGKDASLLAGMVGYMLEAWGRTSAA